MSQPQAPTHLRVNDVVNPVGTSVRPYFGWLVNDSRPNQTQTYYQLLVASGRACLDADVGDIWDSGKVVSSRQNHVAYDGELLLSSNRLYWWKVRTWDKDGQAGPYSEPGIFTTGLLANEEWAGALWIRRESSEADDVTYYRKAVILPSGRIERATLFITAVHKYELFINGHRVGQGPSYHYPQYQYYNAYDVTAHLTPAATNLFAVLTHWFGAGQGRPASARGLLLKTVVAYAGGHRLIVGSDQSWQQRRAAGYVSGQPQRNDEGVGFVEKIDARQLIPDWYAPSYDAGDWQPAVAIGPQPTPPWTGKLHPDLSRIVEQAISPAAISDQGAGRYLVDLGQIYAGRPQITFSGGVPGAVIAMEGGYVLTAGGTVDSAHNQNTDMRYFAIANGREFNFLPQEYLGMRYFQVDNAPMPITTSNFRFISRHATLDGRRSTFTSSHPTLNQVWEMMKYSLTLGAQEQFLDTPTREKGGFLVDSMNESLAAMVVFGERVLTHKTLQEFLHSMDHYWSSAGDWGRMNAVYPNGDGARDIPDFTQAYPVWLWEYYMHSGDKEFLHDNYAQLKSIADYVNRHRDSATGLVHWLTGGSGSYQHGIVDWPPSMRYGYDMTAVARTVVNAYAYADYDIVARIAAELGETAAQEAYRARADALKAAINQRLLNRQGVYVDGLKADGAQSAHVSQPANTLPLALAITPPDKQATILERIKAMKMRSGMVTVYWLIRALGEMDAGEHLIDLYTQATWDGWAKNVAYGATSTWESWDADSGGGLSLSHPWGAVGLVGMQQYILGVKPLAPQYERVQIKPLSFGARLASASGQAPTDRGDILVSWERQDGRFSMRVTLPANVQARVCVPRGNGPGTAVLVDGIATRGRADGRYLVIEDVGSGTYTFERQG